MTDELDMSDTIVAKSDQLNADDLIGGPKIIKITKVAKKSDDQPVTLHFQGDNGKPFKPCKTVRRLLVHLWGKDGAKWVGHSLEIYRDAGVKWGGMEVGGIRVARATGITKTLRVALQVTKGKKDVFEVDPLQGGPAPPKETTPEERKANATAAAQKLVDALAGADDVAAFLEKNKDVVARFSNYPDLKKQIDDAATERNEALKAAKEGA